MKKHPMPAAMRLADTMYRAVLRVYPASFRRRLGTEMVEAFRDSCRTARRTGQATLLGADRRDVSRMVLRQGMILAGVGVIIGLIAAVGLTRLMSSILYGVEATDPLTFGVVAALLTAVALVASYLPALRASKMDPLEALRFE